MSSGGTESILLAMKSYWAMGYARGIKCPEIVSHLSQKLLSVPHKSYAQQQSKISKYDSDMLSAGSYVHYSVNHCLSGFNYRFTSFLTHMLTVLSIRLFCLLASMDLTMGSCPISDRTDSIMSVCQYTFR